MNRKILLICKEAFSSPMYFLGKELESRGNDVAYFFVHNSEVIYNENSLYQSKYHYFKKNIDNAKIFDVRDINLEFIENYKVASYDINYLNNIEKLYGKSKNLNQQIMSSQMSSTPYHYRKFYSELTYEQTLYWLELNYKKAEDILDTFQPDLILDIDTAEIQRTILNEICSVKNIPYINLEYPRYESWVIPTFNLGLEPEDFFKKEYEKNLTEDLSSEIKIIEEFNAQDKIMAKIYKNSATSSYSYSYSFSRSVVKFLRDVYATFKLYVLEGMLKTQAYNLNLPLISNPLKKIAFSNMRDLRKLRVYSKYNKLFQDPVDEDYVYMPLHLIPESTTFVKSPMFVDELSIIQAVSKSLPIGWKLYVKEHQAMLGERPLGFYKEVNKLYNVKVVTINYYKDPKPWIVKSRGVISISGSAAFEARLLGKPSAVFGHVCFNIIEGIQVINSIRDLISIFRIFENYKHKQSDINSCASYLKTIMGIGVELDIKKLILLSGNKISNKELSERELNTLVIELMNFYFNSYLNIIKGI